jgi:hypothetical protein
LAVEGNGTTGLCAAVNAQSGEVMGSLHWRHRAGEAQIPQNDRCRRTARRIDTGRRGNARPKVSSSDWASASVHRWSAAGDRTPPASGLIRAPRDWRATYWVSGVPGRVASTRVLR